MRLLSLLFSLALLMPSHWHVPVWSEDQPVTATKSESEVLAAVSKVRQALESLRYSYLWNVQEKAFFSGLAAGLMRRNLGLSKLGGAIEDALLQNKKKQVDLEKQRDAILEQSKWIESRGYNLRKSAFVDLEEQLKKQQEGDENARIALESKPIAADSTNLQVWRDANEALCARRLRGLPLVEKKADEPVERPINRGADANEPGDIEVLFSPNGGIRDRIIRECSLAKKRISVQAYELTSTEIADALITAAQRGVVVGVILDKNLGSETNAEALNRLRKSQVLLFLDPAERAHSKVIVIDERMVITGSYNFTQSAESRNVENALFISNERIVREYLMNWSARFAMAIPLSR